MDHYTVDQLMEKMRAMGIVTGEGMMILRMLIDTVPAARARIDRMCADEEFAGVKNCIEFCPGHSKE